MDETSGSASRKDIYITRMRTGGALIYLLVGMLALLNGFFGLGGPWSVNVLVGAFLLWFSYRATKLKVASDDSHLVIDNFEGRKRIPWAAIERFEARRVVYLPLLVAVAVNRKQGRRTYIDGAYPSVSDFLRLQNTRAIHLASQLNKELLQRRDVTPSRED